MEVSSCGAGNGTAQSRAWPARTLGKWGVFHANFHGAYRHTPNDEKSAGFRRGRFQTCPGRFRDASGAFSPQGRFETCPYPTALRPYVGEVFHANCTYARYPRTWSGLGRDGAWACRLRLRKAPTNAGAFRAPLNSRLAQTFLLMEGASIARTDGFFTPQKDWNLFTKGANFHAPATRMLKTFFNPCPPR